MPTTHDRRNGFDGLRLFAAWLVLLNHSYPLTGSKDTDFITQLLRIDTSGGLAVCIFFSISGYLVGKSLIESRNIFEFLKRRFFRVYPALAVVVILSVFVLGPIISTLSINEYFLNSKSWLYLKTMSGFNIKYDLPMVFINNPASGVNGSLWSLSIELKCYVLLAIIGIIPISLRIKATILLFYFTLAFLIRPQVNQDNINLSLLGLNYYFSKYGMIFFIGVFISSFFNNLNNRIWMVVGSFTVISFIFSIIFPNDKLSPLIYCYSLAITTIWIGSIVPIISVYSRKYGDVSYGVYLYSFPIQQLLTHFNIHDNGIIIYIGMATLITLALAIASWHWVEKPCLSLKYRNFINSK